MSGLTSRLAREPLLEPVVLAEDDPCEALPWDIFAVEGRPCEVEPVFADGVVEQDRLVDGVCEESREGEQVGDAGS